jgi:hypothetical protein
MKNILLKIKRNVNVRIAPYIGACIVGAVAAAVALPVQRYNESQGMSYALSSQDSTQPVAYKSRGSQVFDMRSDTIRAGPFGAYTTYNHPLTVAESNLVNKVQN